MFTVERESFFKAVPIYFVLLRKLLHGKGLGYEGKADTVKPVNITDVPVSFKEVSCHMLKQHISKIIAERSDSMQHIYIISEKIIHSG
jgi:hypothetical protein